PLDILDEVAGRIVGPADGIFLNSADDFFELLLAPSTIAWIWKGYQLLDEVAERIDLDRSSLGDGFNVGNDRFGRKVLQTCEARSCRWRIANLGISWISRSCYDALSCVI